VDKYTDAGLGEREVWPPRQGQVAAPACEAVLVQQGGETKLRGSVAAAPDPGHDLGALLWSEDISHGWSVQPG
jgi:hypothetical protein